ncbi:MAG: hypothetical protein RBT71_06425 [Flavobacteriales bacterium]|jgi:hypothetical protein|nr:hypothetical protein [Flavobacteriales bacterium]
MVRPLLIALLLLGLVACGPSHTPFVPVVSEQGQLVERPGLMTDSLRRNLVHVLSHYHEDWRMQGGTLLVKQQDRELRWNYTTKAMDGHWLATHPLEQEGP